MLHPPKVPRHYASCLALQYLLLVRRGTCVRLWRKTGVGWGRPAYGCCAENPNDGTHHHFCVGNALEKIYKAREIHTLGDFTQNAA